MINQQYMDILKLPLELLEKIFKFLEQKSLCSTSLVNKQWNHTVNLVWHTIDLSKSHSHFTHLASKVKSLSKNNKGGKKIRVLETICNNLVSNNGFLIPPLSNKNNPIFKKNYNSSSSSSGNNNNNNNNNNSNYIENNKEIVPIENNNIIESNNEKEFIKDSLNLQFYYENSSNKNNDNNNNNDKELTVEEIIFNKKQLKSNGSRSKLEKEIEDRIEKRMDHFFKSICNRFQRVEVLDLSGCTDLKMDSIMLLVRSFSQTLKKLTTRRCKSLSITDERFSQIFQYCKKLTTLSLGEMPLIGDQTITQLSIHCPNLEALGIARCINITDKSIITLSKALVQYQAKNNNSNSNSNSSNNNYSKLKIIGLNHLSHLSDECILMLGLSCSKTLNIFSVCNLVNLTSDTLSKIFLNCRQLGSIDLSGCVNADDTVLESIAMKCGNLFQLNISRLPKVTSSSLKLVAQHCKLIRLLFISKTMVDDDCIVYCVDNLNLLEVLFASHCSNLTDVSIKSILDLGTERLSSMIVNFSSCINISTSLISILQSFTKPTPNHSSNNNNNNYNNNSNNGNNGGNNNSNNSNNNYGGGSGGSNSYTNNFNSNDYYNSGGGGNNSGSSIHGDSLYSCQSNHSSYNSLRNNHLSNIIDEIELT
ncbi:hypothetical protein ACTFIW_007779 [Dictyostelium discoideum]